MDIHHQLGPWEAPYPALMATIEASGICTVTLLGMAYENDRTAVCNRLTKRLGRSVREINDLLDEIKNRASSLASPVVLEGKPVEQKQYMSSGLPTLDRQLGGGFPVGEVSEIFGASGSGKSQLLLQIAGRCSERANKPGVLHISTELPIETRRLFGNKLMVQCIYCPDMEYQDHIMQTQLPLMLEKESSKIGLVIIDSISHHLRRDEALTNVSYLQEKIREQENELEGVTQCTTVVKSLKAQHEVLFKSSPVYRNRVAKNMYIMNLYQSLANLARKHKTAIVVSNQVSDKPELEVQGSALLPLDFESQVGFFVGWDNETIQTHLEGWRETQSASDIYNEVMSCLHKRRKTTVEPQEDPREPKELSVHQQQLLERLHISVNCATKKQVPALGYAWSRRLGTRVLLMKTYRPLVGGSASHDLDSIFSGGHNAPSLSKLVDGWSVERFARVAFAAHAPARNEFHVDKVPFSIGARGLEEY